MKSRSEKGFTEAVKKRIIKLLVERSAIAQWTIVYDDGSTSGEADDY